MSVPFRTGPTKVAESWHVLWLGCNKALGSLESINNPSSINVIGYVYRIRPCKRLFSGVFGISFLW